MGIFLDFGKITEEMEMLRQGEQVDFFISTFMPLIQQFGARPECMLGVRQDGGGNRKC